MVSSSDEFSRDAANTGPEAGREAVFFNKFDLLELADFLSDGIGTFRVVGVVDRKIFRWRPAMRASIKGSGQQADSGIVALRKQVVCCHLFVIGRMQGKVLLNFLEKPDDFRAGAGEEKAGIHVGHAGALLLEEQRFIGRGEKVGEFLRGGVSKENVDIAPDEGFAGVVLQTLQDEGDFFPDAAEEFR